MVAVESVTASEFTTLVRAQAEVLRAKIGAHENCPCVGTGIELAIAASLGLLFEDSPKEN